MRHHLVRRVLAAVVLVTGIAAACGSAEEEGAVHIIHVDGVVGPIMERYIDRTLTDAENSNARAAVLAMDTPGGLNNSMRDIVKRIERADVPVIIYVYPLGSRAASAGTFITMAAHIAAMAPNTSIGAASAINSDGSDIEGALGRKIENDAVAFIRGIAELRGRNADWAEDAVRNAVAVNQTEAVELNVVDFVANDIDHLLAQSEGRTVELRPGVMATLNGLTDATRVNVEMTLWEHILDFLADPTVASLLISLGFLGILIEMGAPGLILPGVGGAIAMIMGFLGFGLLPVDVVGLVLIALGLILISLEVFLPGGLLGGAGAFALVIGAIIAFRDTPAELRPSMWMLVACAATVAVIAFSILLLMRHVAGVEKRQADVLEASRRKHLTG